MIAKNIKGKSFGGCVHYVLGKEHRLLETEGVLADSSESIIQSFNLQRLGRDEIKQPVGHIPIAFSPEDRPRMTDEFILQLAHEYLMEMGISNTQYIIVRHIDTAYDHLHIVYNRIDNDLKLISANNDYKRNIAVCKKLKERHKLTFGQGKENVNRDKLTSPDKIKYAIYDTIKQVLPKSRNIEEFTENLKPHGITLYKKYRSGTQIVEGVSFEKDNIKFRGSQIDRAYSYANLQKSLVQNVRKSQMPNAIGGVSLTAEQQAQLRQGVAVRVDNVRFRDGMVASVYARIDTATSRLQCFRPKQTEVANLASEVVSAVGSLLVPDVQSTNYDDWETLTEAERARRRRLAKEQKTKGRGI